MLNNYPYGYKELVVCEDIDQVRVVMEKYPPYLSIFSKLSYEERQMLNKAFMRRKSVTERLRSNRAELFRGVTRVAPTVTEYWLEATERIMIDIDYTPKQKLKV
ncbi:hypothetical protein Goari_004486 [Gossypium aridum]|uniref:Uncharacterized protein n=1 Tax=Gossypium aridum TaxID=34290 RepID=A0A7J8Y3L9_GOSAI|nr:hypothetical protein [Gossypium aridum]